MFFFIYCLGFYQLCQAENIQWLLSNTYSIHQNSKIEQIKRMKMNTEYKDSKQKFNFRLVELFKY